MNSDTRSFEELISPFYQYMRGEGGLARKTSGDYISRLRFLAARYPIDESLTQERIEEIKALERNQRLSRAVYNTPKAMSDFHSGLMKLLSFLNSGFFQKEADELKIITNDTHIQQTERIALIQARVGQGEFRKKLATYWDKYCAISNCGTLQALLASHIKPWRISDNNERLDVFNGLLLLPNYDKLFDLGLMTFNKHGEAVYSRLLSNEDRQIMRLSNDLRLRKIDSNHCVYLEYHNDNCFIP